MGPRPHLCFFFFIQKMDFSRRIASLYGSQPSSVVLCLHNSDIMTRINSLYGSHTSPVILCAQNRVISTRITSLHGSQTSPVVMCMQTTWLASELLVSMGPSHHLWFVHAKHRLLDQNYKSLWVPALICGFCIQNSDFSTRIASLYGSLPSTVVFACKTATFGSVTRDSMGPRLRLMICECKTSCLDPEWLLSTGPSLHLWFLQSKQRL